MSARSAVAALALCACSPAAAERAASTSQPATTCAVPAVPDAGVTLVPNITYSRDQTLDVALPDPAAWHGPRPLVVLIHGGGFYYGDAAMYDSNATQLATLGYVAATVNYRLTDAATCPAAIQDVRCAVRWLRAAAGTYGIDPARVAVWGESAGGYLAEMANAPLNDCPTVAAGTDTSHVQAVVAFFGPADLPAQIAYNDGGGWAAAFLGDASPEGASPVDRVSPTQVPMLLVHGTLDTHVPYAESEELLDLSLDAGARARLVLLDAGHGFPQLTGAPGLIEGDCAALTFLANHLRP